MSPRSDRWYQRDTEEVLRRLETDAVQGLGHAEAAGRLARHGTNEIDVDERRSPIAIVLSQFSDFMILILIGAAFVSGFVGEPLDAAVIVTIVVINAAVGATQELRAQNAIVALRRVSAPLARVVRNGRALDVRSAELVPGDIVRLEAGNVVAADLRLLEAHDLSTDESTLTGESLPAEKQTAAIPEDEPALGDQRNMAFKATSVVRGRAVGVVVATGLRTEVGHIARMLAKGDDLRTPLQQRLAVFGRNLAVIVLAICGLIFGLGIANGEPPLIMFLTAASLAVAAIPEALPAVVTISLALGAKKLSRKRSLVRNLPAVESLGSVTCICTDKTGTLTENRMNLAAAVVAGATFRNLTEIDSRLGRRLLEALALCNDVSTPEVGDATELALVRAAADSGLDRAAVLERLPRIAELAFDSDRKLMSTVHGEKEGAVVFVKGAPEAVVARCNAELDEQGNVGPVHADALLAKADELAGQGYRVLAIGSRQLSKPPATIDADTLERDLTFLGLVALQDPLRPEARSAIADCQSAGIMPVMITGDHPVTARRIALELGLADGDRVLTGQELSALSDDELDRRVADVRVYARVNPEQKIRIVEALQRRGEIVAMTGDGVNDAPALKQASIGIAMGKRGTDVAREAADMVLLDDNFATIVTAVREGRRVYDNIRKFIRYTMTSNAGEIWVLLLAPFLGLPIPLLPIHILWVNLVTDGLPGLAFSAEPAERRVMQRPPRAPTEGVFAQGTWQHVLWFGVLIGALALGTSTLAGTDDLVYWQTMVFTTLVVAQLFQALALRSEHESLLTIGMATNPFMIWTVVGTLVLQLLVVYVPMLNELLHTTPLALGDLLACLGLGFALAPMVELAKWLGRRRPPRSTPAD